MEDSIFTKIIKGDVPCHKVYEDDNTFAFLDIHPVTKGHILVVPKTQVEFVWDLNKEDYLALMQAVQKIAVHMREVLKVGYVGTQIIGTDVPHAHIHLIPFNTAAEFHRRSDQNAAPADEALLAKLAQALAF